MTYLKVNNLSSLYLKITCCKVIEIYINKILVHNKAIFIRQDTYNIFNLIHSPLSCEISLFL